jgi:glycyl-tRNA synthetase beta chain
LVNVLEARGADRRNVRAVTWDIIDNIRPAEVAAKAQALPAFAMSPQFRQLAVAFKRVKNIAAELKGETPLTLEQLQSSLHEPAETDLLKSLIGCTFHVQTAVETQNYVNAIAQLSELGPRVDRFFVDVLVMADDPDVRRARLSLMAHLRDAVRSIADVSEIVADEKQT